MQQIEPTVLMLNTAFYSTSMNNSGVKKNSFGDLKEVKYPHGFFAASSAAIVHEAWLTCELHAVVSDSSHDGWHTRCLLPPSTNPACTMTGKEQTKPSNFWEKLRGKFKGSPNTMEEVTNGESCVAFFFKADYMDCSIPWNDWVPDPHWSGVCQW
jgi:hypothetical protein